MIRSICIFTLAVFLFSSCSPNGESNENKTESDSTSKAQQKKHSDSLKKNNPLLIMPPDSTYTGDYIDKYANGVIKFRGQFRFGERHGQWMSFFPDGSQWSEMHYDKGLREGPNIVFFQGGKKRYEGFYKADKQDSVWVYFDSTGTVAEKALYKNDHLVKKLPLK